jgi:hypothetical protein
MTGNGDIKAQQQTYGKVMGVMKWGAVASFGLAAFVVWLIAG